MELVLKMKYESMFFLQIVMYAKIKLQFCV